MRFLYIALLLLFGVTSASAQEPDFSWADENRISFSDSQTPVIIPEPRFGIKFDMSLFRPSFSNAREHYDMYFGAETKKLMFQATFQWYLLKSPVYISAHGTLGFWQEYAKSKICRDTQGAVIACDVANAIVDDGNDPTSFNLLPLSIGVEAKIMLLKDWFNIPIVPYARGSFLYTVWWVWTGGELGSNDQNEKGIGGIAGLAGTAGVLLNLDFIDSNASQSMYRNWGIVDSYLYFEYTWSQQNHFSDNRLDLSSDYWTVGFALDF